MQSTDTLKKHAALMDRMATTLGVDLEEAALRGKLQFDEIADAVLSCTGCANPQECGHWLDHNSDGASATPSYCRNSDLLQRLREV